MSLTYEKPKRSKTFTDWHEPPYSEWVDGDPLRTAKGFVNGILLSVGVGIVVGLVVLFWRMR